MKLYGGGRVAIVADSVMAQRLGWVVRPKSAGEPDLVLSPWEGDPRHEPWIAPMRFAKGSGPESVWRRKNRHWTYLPKAVGIEKYMQRLARPSSHSPKTIGISGLGRVGGTAVAVLSAMPVRLSGIGEILIHDCDAANQERWFCELGSIVSWRRTTQHPRIRVCGLDEMFSHCDAFLFSAAKSVPPLGSEGDVRLTQFAPNREILDDEIKIARNVGYSGLFFVVSDPVECLAQAAFHDSNVDASGRFIGQGLAPERIAGLALGVMWGRAVAAARGSKREFAFESNGVPFGPHSTEVMIMDDPTNPDLKLSQMVTEAARHGNYHLRKLGFLPYLGPAISSISLTLPLLFSGKEALASCFVDGIYFGAPSKLSWGIHPVPRAVSPEVKTQLVELHTLLSRRMKSLGLLSDA